MHLEPPFDTVFMEVVFAGEDSDFFTGFWVFLADRAGVVFELFGLSFGQGFGLELGDGLGGGWGRALGALAGLHAGLEESHEVTHTHSSDPSELLRDLLVLTGEGVAISTEEVKHRVGEGHERTSHITTHAPEVLDKPLGKPIRALKQPIDAVSVPQGSSLLLAAVALGVLGLVSLPLLLVLLL